jgi:hypothetical protein
MGRSTSAPEVIFNEQQEKEKEKKKNFTPKTFKLGRE